MNQDDFRRLLATPQPIKKNKFKVPKKENSISKSDLSKPKPKKKWKRPVNEEVDKHYRDRAKERRQEMNPDYEETKAIFSMLNKNSDVEINEKTLTYEQSKYLGGDESHTHLVKGLDYAFLQKIRKELEMKKMQEKKDDEAKAYVEQIHGDIQKPSFNSILAKNIHYWAVEKPKEQLPLKNEMFIAGRMAFVWELGLENGFYIGSSDIPITLQRSKAEIKNYQDKFDVSTNDLVIDKISQIMVNVRLGIRNVQNPSIQEKKKIKKKDKAKKIKKTEKTETPAEDYEDIFDDVGINYKLDFEKNKNTNKDDKEKIQKKEFNSKKDYFGSNINEEEDKNDDDKEKDNISNIELFKGSKLLEKLMANNYEKDKAKNKKEINHTKIINDKSNENNHFEMDLDDLGNNENDDNNDNDNDKKLNSWQSDADIGPLKPPENYSDDKLLNTWQSDADIGPLKPPENYDGDNLLNTWQSDADIGPSKPPENYDNNELLNTWQSDADIGPSRPSKYNDQNDTNGESQKYYEEEYISKSNVNVPEKIKPLSKEKDNDLDYSDSTDSEEDNDYAQIDLGTNRNKQRQLKRWDFDTEEEWKQYKDNCVILPKAAFQYGIKLSDGRQKSMHHKSDNKSKDEKLNRELKQIEKIMDDKYRKPSSSSSSKHSDSNHSREREREYNHDHDYDHSSSSHSHSNHHHSSSKRHSRSRWDDDDDDRHNKRNRH